MMGTLDPKFVVRSSSVVVPKYGVIVRFRHQDPVTRVQAGTEAKVISADDKQAFVKVDWKGLGARGVTVPLGYLEPVNEADAWTTKGVDRIPDINPVSLRPGVDIVTVVSYIELLPFGTKCLWLGVKGGGMAEVRAKGKDWPISIFNLAELDPVQSNVDLHEFMVGYHTLAETIGDREQCGMGQRVEGNMPTAFSRGAVKAAKDHREGLLGRSRLDYHAYNEAMRELAAEYPEEHVALPAEVKV
jgi:hypothetical protein